MGTEDGSITIIDWEFAGWYPSYWEYARAIFACGRFDDDWSEWIDFSLDVYRNEWAWMQMLIVELWSQSVVLNHLQRRTLKMVAAWRQGNIQMTEYCRRV